MSIVGAMYWCLLTIDQGCRKEVSSFKAVTKFVVALIDKEHSCLGHMSWHWAGRARIMIEVLEISTTLLFVFTEYLSHGQASLNHC